MTAEIITLSGTTYTATMSSLLTGPPNRAFDNRADHFVTFQPRYNPPTGAYTGTATTNSVLGEWVQLEMNNSMLVSRYELSVHTDHLITRAPESCILFGSADGNTWVQMDSQSGLSWSTTTKSFMCSNPGTYYFLRLVFPRIVIGTGNGNTMSILEITYFS
jgi:hypothetical protein